MIIYWWKLLAGLAFGLLPARMLLNSECRYLTFEDLWSKVLRPEQPEKRRRRWWKLPLVWIDPFRGYVVASFLIKTFSVLPPATAFQKLMPTIVGGSLLLIVMWTQTKGRPDEDETLSPAGFIAGAMFGLLAPTVALAALVLGAATALAMQGYTAGYLVAAATVAGMGYIFNPARIYTLVVTTMLVASPVVIAWLRRTRLVTPVRY